MGNTQIWICMECAGMGLNLHDIAPTIQWEISKHYTVGDLLQQFRRAGGNGQSAISLVFMEKKHILPEDVDELEGSDFVNMQLRVETANKTGVQELVSKLYDSSLQTTCKNHLMIYHRVNPAILLFVNLVGCRQQLALALFMCKRAFCTMNHEACYDTCLYAIIEVGQIPSFDLHGTTKCKLRVYFQTTEWQDHLLAAERNRLLAYEIVDKIKTTTAQQNAYKITLISFARITWPDNDIDCLQR